VKPHGGSPLAVVVAVKMQGEEKLKLQGERK